MNKIIKLIFVLATALTLHSCAVIPEPEAELSIILHKVNGNLVNDPTSIKAVAGEKLLLEFNLLASKGIRRFEVIPNNTFNANFEENGVDLVRKTIIAEFSIPSSLEGTRLLNFRLEDFEQNVKELQVAVAIQQREVTPSGPPIFPF